MKKAKPLFIILLILVAMANFHIIQSDYDIPAHTEYTIQSDDSQHVSNSKILTHVYVYMRAAVSAVQSPSMELAAALCLLTLSLYRIKSHIEYCGKKMVRAIMLQFHPRQQPLCIVPAGALFFCKEKAAWQPSSTMQQSKRNIRKGYYYAHIVYHTSISSRKYCV